MGYNDGARDKERLTKAFKVAFSIAFVIMTVGLILFQLFPRQFLSLFNASEGMYQIGIPALRTISLCFIPASFGILASSFFQAAVARRHEPLGIADPPDDWKNSCPWRGCWPD